jgi:hypothetical protein
MGAELNTLYAEKINRSQSQIAFNGGETFIFIYYDSSRSNYQESLAVIQEAIEKLQKRVHFVDAASEGDYSDWFPHQLYSLVPNPTVFFIADSMIIDDRTTFPSADTLQVDMEDFLREHRDGYMYDL